MRERIKLFLHYGLFWLIFFISTRIIFLTYYYDKTAELSFTEILLMFTHGIRLDLSATGYFLLLPGLFLTISPYITNKPVRFFFHIYTGLMLFIASFIVVMDLEMYKHWAFRLDVTPLLYIGQDTTIAIEAPALSLLIFIWLLIFGVFMYLYSVYIYPYLVDISKSTWKHSFIPLILTALLIAPIRGSFGVAPINVGTVYYDNEHLFGNHGAINVVWNVGYALRKLEKLEYPENILDEDKTDQYFKQLYTSSGETEKVLTTDRPNVIVIVIESFTFRLIEPLGGIPGVAPNLSKIATEGLLFDNIYASGDRTDKGIVSVLSGYPAQPTGSIIKYPKKTQNLPFLSKNFNEMGYETGFTYGGSIDFANFRSYFTTAQFDHLTHSSQFADSLNNSKWGVHDGPVFEKFYKEINELKSPFFKVMLTLSSHEPFNVPMKTVFEGDDEVSKFLNSAHYTDKSLGEFMDKARHSDWWDNTLIVITADHGHPTPDNEGLANPDRYRIPLIWTGGALAQKGRVIHNIGSQTDIPNTILGQVSTVNNDYIFSNNLLDKNYHDFAVFIFNNGYAYIDDNQKLTYDQTGKQYLIKEGANTEEQLWPSLSYIQKLYRDYNHR
ncbi:LTA synthase family protein [Fulvivirga ligni]|uniref:LTA synthase family protein n=1 Tax=Fulvivirga ligni TaxID=2904246 RepID=UPI001F38CE9A|nr:alkaline phosphatase family protein [Fulvivirga ligni]UII23561.1 sulfatase-like hydrolase/transferase [Fulvivirga ligni]